jgi:hypothetical protein
MISRRVLAFGILALATIGASMAADAWVVGFNSVGPVKVGMSLSQLSTVLHQKFAMPENKEDQACFYVSPAKHPQISFMIEEGRLVRIDVDKLGVSTVEGVQVGDSEKRAKEVYPDIRVKEHAYTPEGHHLTVQSKDGQHGIRFETENGKIQTFYAGTYQAIQYVEGCQ